MVEKWELARVSPAKRTSGYPRACPHFSTTCLHASRSIRELLSPYSNQLFQRFKQTAIDELHLTVRAYDRILKLEWTIADLEAAEHISVAHLSEAVQYRNLDWGKMKG